MTQTAKDELRKVWDVSIDKQLTDDEERYLELMNEDELTFEESEFCRNFEKHLL